MEKPETFQQLKLTLLNQKTKIIFAVIVGISVASLASFFADDSSCAVKQVAISNEIKDYEKELDPEICESIVFRIDEYNQQCNANIETLDCG